MMDAVGLLSRHQACAHLEGVQQEDVDLSGKGEAEQKPDHQGAGADDQAPAQFDQMFEQGAREASISVSSPGRLKTRPWRGGGPLPRLRRYFSRGEER